MSRNVSIMSFTCLAMFCAFHQSQAAECNGVKSSLEWSADLCHGGTATPGANDDLNLCGMDKPCDSSPALFNWIIGTESGTRLSLQYAAAYQWSKDDDTGFARWWRVDSSSANYDNSAAAQDMNSDRDEGFLNSYPGGSTRWAKGFTPYGPDVKSVGAPGMLFVLQTKGGFNIRWTWYILQQWTLNLGANADCLNPQCGVERDDGTKTNCWDFGAGELDIIEMDGTGAYNCANTYCTPCPDDGEHPQVRKCIEADGVKYFKMFDEDHEPSDSTLYAAVVDANGLTIYTNPVWYTEDEEELGLTETLAKEKLQSKPKSADRTRFSKLKGGITDACDNTEQLPPNDPDECSHECSSQFCPTSLLATSNTSSSGGQFLQPLFP